MRASAGGMKKLFLEIYLLTLADGFCTGAGVYAGYVREANPLLEAAVEAQPFGAPLAACLLVGIILWGLYRIGGGIRFLPAFLLILLAFKLLVLGLHFIWLAQAV